MNPDRLTSLLKAANPANRDRTPACPDEHQIAAYVDGTLAPEPSQQLDLHLADCDACLALVGLLSRERDPVTLEPVPDLTLERARRVAHAPHRPAKRHGAYLAAAAALVLSVSVLLNVSQRAGNGPESPADAPAVRKVPTDLPSLRLLSPEPGTTLRRNQLIVRWTAVPGTHYYDVRVVTDSGDVVTEKHVTGTEWRPRNVVALQPGMEYFVHVDAYVANGKAIGSEHVSFHVTE